MIIDCKCVETIISILFQVLKYTPDRSKVTSKETIYMMNNLIKVWKIKLETLILNPELIMQKDLLFTSIQQEANVHFE